MKYVSLTSFTNTIQDRFQLYISFWRLIYVEFNRSFSLTGKLCYSIWSANEGFCDINVKMLKIYTKAVTNLEVKQE